MTDSVVVGPDRLDELRVLIGSGRSHIATSALDQFAASMTSRSDAALLRRFIRDTPSATSAARGAMALYTMAGIGDLACDLRGWFFATSHGDIEEIETTAPLLLWKCATQLADANSVRALIEFGGRESFREFVNKITTLELPIPFPDCLSWDRAEQVQSFMKQIGRHPRLRDVQLCRNYADEVQVYELLLELSSQGSVAGMSALFFGTRVVPWSVVATVRPCDESEAILVFNCVVENVRRGQPLQELVRLSGEAPLIRRFIEEWAEYLEAHM